jgi:hypothetical protein
VKERYREKERKRERKREKERRREREKERKREREKERKRERERERAMEKNLGKWTVNCDSVVGFRRSTVNHSGVETNLCLHCLVQIVLFTAARMDNYM